MSLHSVDCWRPFFHHCTVLEHWWRSLFQYVRMTLKAFPLVHGSICLFWCHYPTLLIAVTLQYALNSGSVKPPFLFLLSRLPWLFGVVCGFLHILREKISLSIKCHWISVRCCSESVHHFGGMEISTILTSVYEQCFVPTLFSVQLLSWVRLFVTPRAAAHQASLFFTISWSLLKFMAIELVMLSFQLVALI